MNTAFVQRTKTSGPIALKLLLLLALVASALVVVPHSAFAATTATDDFNRANGSLGANWTDMNDAGLAIASQQVVGTNNGYSGDIRTGESYASDQYSQIEITSTQLSGGQWIGAAVRAQNGGQDTYLGLYFWNNGNPVMMLFKRLGGGWTQLGSTYASGALAAGTQLTLSATGSSLTFSENGVARIASSDSSLTGGAPGIMAFGTPAADNWSGGDNVSSGTTYSVGGSVTGLSGTVVLANNAGDALSVGADGPFTFPTQLATGAAYNVTVQTNPTGQTCTVLNGSGSISSANVSNVSVTCATTASGTATDDFNRANGSLGANWTDMNDAGLAIASQQVVGTNNGYSGDIRTGENYASDQYSQIEITSTQLSGGQWIGAAVRAQNGGQDTYLGLYFWNNGNPVMMLFKRLGGGWTQLGSTYASGALAAGTQLTLSATGSSLTFSENGVARIASSDSSLTGGAPGIMAFGTPAADNWSGGDNVSSGTTYSVGGSVTGLSGTVVLANNAGDALSVGADGPFTFTTQLATGAAYNVTVQTNPTGQTCTVLNGSGSISSANVSNVSVTCATTASGTATDDFNRANGSLGANWTDMNDAGLAIASQQVVGTNNGYSGDIRTGENYASDQYSQIEITSTQLSGGQWIGAAVRAQNGGQDTYLGLYFWNNGNPVMMLFKRIGGGWTQLGSTYASGALAAGTQLTLSATGSSLTFSENGVARIASSDSSLTGGAPGIMAFGTPAADNWSGGDNVSSGTTYSVGGSVTGLSGTVVLANNAGDALSVGADGPFTFTTQLATGAAYNVTVQTNPTGQTCTVLNGSGSISSANVSNVSVTCATTASGTATDDFNRANGSLGANWTDMNDAGLAIASQQVVGTNNGYSGDIRTGENYASDQYSQIEITSTQLSGGQWIGAAVRAQNGGQDTYLGLYFWNNGNPVMMLFKRLGGGWTQLGSTYASGALAAGTQLKLMAVGNTLSFLVNGVERIAVGDSSLTGGAPGIMAFGTPAADNWSGGTAGFEVHYLSTDSSGVASYDMISANDGYGPQILRVLQPTHPAAGVAHNFLYVLPVEAGLGTSFGDGMQTMQALDAEDQYNLTIIEPSFDIEPWYANDPNDANLQYETFMTTELQPWVKATLSTSGTEQHWLIGFSKSGIGGEDLLLKHPNLFTLAASWDFPADMSSYDQYAPGSTANYGTDANFQANYRLTPSFLASHASPFTSSNRIWIGGFSVFPQDVTDYNSLLTAEGILHTLGTPQAIAHRWDSGWVPNALAALYQDSLSQH